MPAAGQTAVQSPVAIVGIGCRFPGARGPAAFWRLLRDGVDAVTEIPADRWNQSAFYDPRPGIPGKTNSRWGGVIDGVDQFDAGFFGIAPREAARMDPQQRQLLEVAWEALEDAGLTAEQLAGRATGVFVGLSSQDYLMIQTHSGETSAIDAHFNPGVSFSIAANRISYCLNLRGPSLAIDTACSSSLTAVHLACQSLARGECRAALAGGVNVLLRPDGYVGFSRLSMMSPTGRCKAFAADADGFVRSEGAAMIVLKPLALALSDGDLIYALLLGSAVNQDGHTPGLTVPSQAAQTELILEACRSAGIDPGQLQYVEAHGTGTPVGDPIEAQALGRAVGLRRPKGLYCLIGSAKANIGHPESAAGIAGLVKVALALRHRALPPQIHCQQPNPVIPFESLRLRIATELQPWPQEGGPARAGVNSFGFGGSNAHAILQEPPREQPIEEHGAPLAAPRGPGLFPLSARSPDALRAVALACHDFLRIDAKAAEFSVDDLCHTAGVRRTHHEHRAALIVRAAGDLPALLADLAAGEPRAEILTGRQPGGQPVKLAFVCAGQGPQWWGMGRQLFQREPVFRQVIEQCSALMAPHAPWSLVDEMQADPRRSRIDDTDLAQPAIFALQMALAALWRSWGILPDAVVGHSVGEVAAACLAGVLTLEEAARLIVERGRVSRRAPEHGRMLAVGLPLPEAAAWVARYPGQMWIAAVNGPEFSSLSGDAEALAALHERLREQNVFSRFVRMNYAAHSGHLDPLRDDFLASIRGLDHRPPNIPIYSTVTGGLASDQPFDASYWWRNIRDTVRFAEAMAGLFDAGHAAFVELAPHPVLQGSMTRCAAVQGIQPQVLCSLRRDDDEMECMLRGLAALYCLGKPVAWRALNPRGRFVRLPTYPWQHERFWNESEASRRQRVEAGGHRLLGTRLDTTEPVWQNKLDCRVLPELADHRLRGRAVLSATSYIEMALAAARALQGPGPRAIEDFELPLACLLPDDERTCVEFRLREQDGAFTVHSRQEPATAWQLHARGTVRGAPDPWPADRLPIEQLRRECGTTLEPAECYQRLAALGLDYGPSFRGICQLWCGPASALGQVRATAEVQTSLDQYEAHPALLDACLQVIEGLLHFGQDRSAGQHGLFLPVGARLVRMACRLPAELWCHASLVVDEREKVVDLRIGDARGNVVAEILGLRCRFVGAADDLRELTWRSRWRLGAPPARRAARPQLPRPTDILARLEQPLKALGGSDERDARGGQLRHETDMLCAAYIAQALAELGVALQPGQRFTTADVMRTGQVHARHARQFERFLRFLRKDGLLEGHGAPWQVPAQAGTEPAATQWSRLFTRYPACQAELMLVARCGARLAPILRGDLDPLHCIFPEGSLAEPVQLYRDSASLRSFNKLAAAAVGQIIAGMPRHDALRILEIGAGTGGLTAHLAPVLPADRTKYLFTDVSGHFITKAQEHLGDFAFLDFQKLDIEQDPLPQGFESQAFDLVVASNVLHATASLRDSLAHIRQLMAPGALLLILELHNPPRWIELVFGLTEGWWRFADCPLRCESPLLALPDWQDLLGKSGFTDACGLSETTRPMGNLLIMARAADQPPAGGCCAPHTQPASGAPWLLLADKGGFALRLAAAARSAGHEWIVALPGNAWRNSDPRQFELNPHDADDIRRLIFETCAAGAPGCARVVDLRALDAEVAPDATTEEVMRAYQAACGGLALLVQALDELPQAQVPQLCIVTRGAQSARDAPECTAIAQAGAWGVGRVALNEVPKLRTRLIDLGAAAREDDVAILLEELEDGEGDSEVALRGTGRYVHRYEQGLLAEAASPASSNGQAFRLEAPATALLEHLAWRQSVRSPPREGQIEIEVAATGLNFSDVMKALGLYPGLGPGAVPLGIECAGVVSAVGPGVSRFALGDEVVALAGFSFGSHAVANVELAAPLPPQLSFELAATLPVAFTTARYALEHLGRMRAGERVLIHSAAGGVGLAALQLARRAGAEVYATAGTAQKRALLGDLGIRHVADSRSPAFAEQIRAQSGGQGADLVLNSLPGPSMAAGLSLLREGGRFLEIGKRDIYENGSLGLRPFRNNVAYMAVDLDLAIRERPREVARVFQSVMSDVARGTLEPLSCRVFSAAHVTDAFRTMAQARHVGKAIVSLRTEQPPVLPAAAAAGPPVRADATYLFSGGLGGVALEVARWLVSAGARHLVLAGRRGDLLAHARDAVDALRAAGARVEVARVDVADPAQVAQLLAGIRQSMPALRGVFHAAMVLEDCPLSSLSPEGIRKVAAPKVAGAWNLHRQTLHDPIEIFVMFSSLASIFGSPGQANYAAACAVLDALAAFRRSQQLPALTVNFGPVAEVGYVASNAEFIRRFEALGVLGLAPREVLAALDVLLRSGAVNAGAMRIDWVRLQASQNETWAARAARLCPGSAGGQPPLSGTPDVPTLANLAGAPPAERHDLAVQLLCGLVGHVLGAAADRVDRDKPLTELGLDSLMAVEVRNRIDRELRVTLGTADLMRGPTITQLAHLVVERLPQSAAPAGNGMAVGRDAAGTQVTAADAAAATRAAAPAVADQPPWRQAALGRGDHS